MKRNLLIALALIVVLCLAGWTFATSRPAIQQWEYKVENGIAEKKINDLGTQGWEIASCGSYNGGMPYCIFKRPK